MELPMVAMENQHDGVRNKWADQMLMDFTTDLVKAIKAEDARRALPADARTFDYLLKKYGLGRTAEDAHNRPKHKQDAERLTRVMWDRYDATELLDEFARAEQAKPPMNRHDMADAFLLAMECAVRRWTLYCKEVLPRRKRGEMRPDAAPLPDDPDRGTIRVLGIDPGTRNIGVCLLELVGMQLPPLPDGDASAAAEPEPLFRVLMLDLVDLKALPLAVLHHAPAAPRLLRPNYDHEDIGVLLKRALAVVAAKKEAAARRKVAIQAEKEARQARKRKREEEAAAAGEPTQKKHKRELIDLTAADAS
jgi:hypothetical protein